MFKVNDVVVSKISGDKGTVESVNLGSGLRDCVLVRFHDKNGRPQGEGLCIPRSKLTLA